MTPGREATHDDRCESEFITGPMAWSPCGCAERTVGRETTALPDLDLSPSIPCGDEGCRGNAAGDGTSWWCETCGGTWDADGTRGERVASPARQAT